MGADVGSQRPEGVVDMDVLCLMLCVSEKLLVAKETTLEGF